MNFSSIEFVQISTRKHHILDHMQQSLFYSSLFNIDKIIDSVGFHDCRKSKQRSGNIVVKIARSSFVESSPNFPWIKSNNVSELQVTNFIFNKGKATAFTFKWIQIQMPLSKMLASTTLKPVQYNIMIFLTRQIWLLIIVFSITVPMMNQ